MAACPVQHPRRAAQEGLEVPRGPIVPDLARLGRRGISRTGLQNERAAGRKPLGASDGLGRIHQHQIVSSPGAVGAQERPRDPSRGGSQPRAKRGDDRQHRQHICGSQLLGLARGLAVVAQDRFRGERLRQEAQDPPPGAGAHHDDGTMRGDVIGRHASDHVCPGGRQGNTGTPGGRDHDAPARTGGRDRRQRQCPDPAAAEERAAITYINRRGGPRGAIARQHRAQRSERRRRLAIGAKQPGQIRPKIGQVGPHRRVA